MDLKFLSIKRSAAVLAFATLAVLVVIVFLLLINVMHSGINIIDHHHLSDSGFSSNFTVGVQLHQGRSRVLLLFSNRKIFQERGGKTGEKTERELSPVMLNPNNSHRSVDTLVRHDTMKEPPETNKIDDSVIEPERIGEECSKDDIVVYQGPTAPLPNGIPTYTVQILNVCLRSGCTVSHVHLRCGWFSSTRLINPVLFRRVDYDDCLVNNGMPIPRGGTVSFQYANTFHYPLAVSSVSCSFHNTSSSHIPPPLN